MKQWEEEKQGHRLYFGDPKKKIKTFRQNCSLAFSFSNVHTFMNIMKHYVRFSIFSKYLDTFQY